MKKGHQMSPIDVQDREAGGINSLTAPNAGFASSVLPKVQPITLAMNSYTGVSTGCAHTAKKWYALRATYGREKEAAEYLASQGIECYRPTIRLTKSVGDKETIIEQSRIPNIFFANSTLEILKEQVYDNFHVETKYLRFYYNHHHDGTKEPLVVPEGQMRSLRIICEAYTQDVRFFPSLVEKFRTGQRVLVKEGEFAGVEGIVARFCRQQRVGIVIEGLGTAVTAYIPSGLLKTI